MIESEPHVEPISGFHCSTLQLYGVGGSVPGVVREAVCHVYAKDSSVIESEPYGESISGFDCSALQPYCVEGSMPGAVMVAICNICD